MFWNKKNESAKYELQKKELEIIGIQEAKAQKEAELRQKESELQAAKNRISELEAALASAPKVQPPESPIRFVCKDKAGNNYYTFKAPDQITAWRAEGIFKAINNASLSVSDTDLIAHEQSQNELLTRIMAASAGEKAELQRQYYHNSARLQERIRHCGEYQFLLTLAKLVMVCEGEPLLYEDSAKWDKVKEERMKADSQLLGFFLPEASALNEALKNYQNAGYMDSLVRLLQANLNYQTSIQKADTSV